MAEETPSPRHDATSLRIPATARTLALLTAFSLLLAACDGDPYRVGAEPSPDGGVVIHFANCGDDRVSKVSLSSSGETRSLLWEVESVNAEGENLFEFPVGSQPPGFDVTVPLSGPLPESWYLIVVDSTFLEDQHYAFNSTLLRDGYVLGGNNQHFTVEEFRSGALCD